MIHHVVINTSLSAGAIYSIERDGRLYRSLSQLRLNPDPLNKVRVSRVSRQDGEFLAMVGPATLKVSYKDPATGSLVDIDTYTAAAFHADKYFEFDLTATDFADYNGKELHFEFKDATAVTLTANVDSLTLYANRAGFGAPKEGCWGIVSAAVSNHSNRRVIFRSTNPSIARVEAPSSSGVYAFTGQDLQDGQWCIVVGVEVGSCQVECVAEGDESQTDVVDIIVKPHPIDDADVPVQPKTGLAADLEALLDNVRLPLCLKDDAEGDNAMAEFGVAFSRSFSVPGGEGDTFDLTLNFAGTIPTQHTGAYTDANLKGHVRPGLQLVVGLANSATLGTPQFTEKDGANLTTGPIESHTQLGCASAYVLNGPTDLANLVGTATEVLNKSVTLRVQGGDTIVLGWVFSDALTTHLSAGIDFVYPMKSLGFPAATYGSPPEGEYYVLCTVTSCVHHPPNEAP